MKKVVKKQTHKPTAMATGRQIRLRSRGKICNIVFECKSKCMLLNRTSVRITLIVLREKTLFKYMMESFAKRLWVGVEMMVCSFKGRVIAPESTASDLDMNDGCVVDVSPSQLYRLTCAKK